MWTETAYWTSAVGSTGTKDRPSRLDTGSVMSGKKGKYYDDFADYPLDVTGNGRPDIVAGGGGGDPALAREPR